MNAWWETFFDLDYLQLWGAAVSPRTAAEVDGLWQLLSLAEDSRVLDAPCGYGRLSRPLAERGARVVGVDQSADLLAHAERDRGDLPPERLTYLRRDLRQPLDITGFDAAMNVFSSLGYGSEADDLAILRTLAAAVRPGGLVLVETMHRDLFIAGRAHGVRSALRLPDGTLFLEEVSFDPLAGRADSRYYWSGPSGAGEKSSSMRVYAITELVRLVEAAGLRVRSAHRGCSPESFEYDPASAGGRVALLAERS